MLDLGYRVARITDPGTLDGGDVLKVGGTAYVGLGGRTNGAGITQLGQHLREVGLRTQAVTVDRALHLKSAVTALPDGTVIGWDPVVDWPDAFPAYEGMQEEGGAHVVLLDDTTLLMSASAPRTAALLRGRGHDVVTVDISEFEKLEGCVTCLSVRVRDPDLTELVGVLAGAHPPRWVVVAGTSLATWGVNAARGQQVLEQHYREVTSAGDWEVFERRAT